MTTLRCDNTICGGVGGDGGARWDHGLSLGRELGRLLLEGMAVRLVADAGWRRDGVGLGDGFGGQALSGGCGMGQIGGFGGGETLCAALRGGVCCRVTLWACIAKATSSKESSELVHGEY